MENILKRVTLFLGVALLIISMYFSYDGFDQNVTGGNPAYSSLAKFIGITLALTVSVIQFVFNTDFRNLNMTLKGVGFLSYSYSIWTNYLGIKHILQADEMTSWVIAVFMDVTPESLIAWSVGESLRGDFLGNLTKVIFGVANSHKQEDQRKNNLRSPEQPADGYKRQNDQQKGQQHNQSKKHHSEKPGRIRLIPDGLRNQVRSESSKHQPTSANSRPLYNEPSYPYHSFNPSSKPLFDEDDETRPLGKFLK